MATDATGGTLRYDRVLSMGRSDVAGAEVDGDAVAWLFYTSGTTGRPKGAMLTHRNLLAMAMDVFADIYPLIAADIVLHAAPLTHGSGLYAIPAVAKGAHNVVMPVGSFDPGAVLREVAERRVTVIAFLSPIQMMRLVRCPERSRHDLAGLRRSIYGGAPIAARDAEEAVSALEFVGEIARNAYGKVTRRELREPYRRGRARRI